MKNKNTLPLYVILYEEIRDKILSGEIPPSSKLPSIRGFAEKRGVSTTTIENTYQQLLIEGYIESSPKRGYYSIDIKQIPSIGMPKHQYLQKETQQTFNDTQSQNLFDIDAYRKIVNTLFIEDKSLYSACEPMGEPRLQRAIQKHLHTMRDVYSHPNSIVIGSGIQQLLIQLTPLFKKREVAYLKPAFSRAKNIFEFLEYTIHACDDIEDIIKAKPDIIYLSPSNIYPSGKVIPINDRLALIEYATQNNALIIEDDYNHLFRYNAYQIPAIHALSKGKNVIYIGSFSRNTLLSNRMSYMVLPDSLLAEYQSTLFTQTVSKIDQLAMARFIEEGHYLKHLKKLAKHSKRKNEALKLALNSHMINDHYTIYGLESNMHFVIRASNKTTFNQFSNKLDAQNFLYRTFDEQPLDILVPYSGIDIDDMPTVINRLFS